MVDNSLIKEFIERQQAAGFAGFQGTVINFRLPISEALANELVQTTVEQRQATFQQVQLAFKAENHAHLSFTVRKWWLNQRVNLDLIVEPRINFPTSPILQIRLSPQNFLLDAAIEFLLLLKGQPSPHVRARGRLIEIDVGGILEQQHWGEWRRYIKFAEVIIVEGTLLLYVTLEVD
ncbi:MAG: hypothetical protein JO316_24125 [Abitibacteriaceae bacterium]|nr:hypothetical protein [Abditibacteriaceae bacterium]